MYLFRNRQHADGNGAVLKDFELASHGPGSRPDVGDDLLLVLDVLKHLLRVVTLHTLILFVFIIRGAAMGRRAALAQNATDCTLTGSLCL